VSNSNDIVSVVITCYNQGHFLSQAIDSVLNQTDAQHELIVVDDGSTDDTKSIAQTYGNILYIHQSNQGVSVARNVGVRESRGAYLTFLDADDRFLPYALAAGLGCFRKYPSSGFVVGRYRKIAADGSPISRPNVPSCAHDFYKALLLNNVIGMHATVLYRRAVLKHVGGFVRHLKCSEDYDIALRIAQTFSVAEHDNLIAEYRWHDQNMSLDYRFMLQGSLDALHEQWPYVDEKPQYKLAFKTGIANWRRHYGQLMIDDLRGQVARTGLTWGALRRSLSIVRCYPQSFASLAKAALGLVTRSLSESSLSRRKPH
jgi:glycosyltransferase involved in cell wall biosynthesis